MVEMTDGEAIRQVVQGDVEAFSILLGRYHPECLRYARRLLGNPEAAEEVVQDAFLRAFRSLRNYDHRDQFRAWLFKILVNRCRTRAAREKKRSSVIVTADLPETPARAAGPGEPGRQREIDLALGRLAPDQREAFLLKYVEDLSYQEISRMTGHSISALKMRVMRAREELQRILGSSHGTGTGQLAEQSRR